jgi:hypothetical protein
MTSSAVPSLEPWLQKRTESEQGIVSRFKRSLSSLFNGSSNARNSPNLEQEFGSLWLRLSNAGWVSCALESKNICVSLIGGLSQFESSEMSHFDGCHRYLVGELLKLIDLKSVLSISGDEMRDRTLLFEERLKAAAKEGELGTESALFEEIQLQSLALETDLKRFEIVQLAALNIGHELKRVSEDLGVLQQLPHTDRYSLFNKRNTRLQELESGLERVRVLFSKVPHKT